MCIEDPFDLGRNLGSAMSKKMAQFIRMVFLRARERFGTPPVNYSDTYYETVSYQLSDQRCVREIATSG